jgi:hypothetical protein
MNEVVVSKAELLTILEKNREQHKKDAEDALNGYYIEAKEKFLNALEAIRERKDIPHINLFKPVSHVEQYDRAIGMLKMHVNDTVTLSMEEYASYVDDEWDWKHQWQLSNTAYLSKVRSA